MVQNIRAALLENLKTVTWMDSITKEAAKEKVTMVTIDFFFYRRDDSEN